ncbi:pectin methylesterase, family CE8 [Zostera marina]|uniref:Pectinesterase n=1 Tax=Zostera marina TaxID=29655 RepID=A0A0K9NP67_ZOSMR|nr:pectin methylesterase, family CE8 [Zostera marina]
MSFHQDFGPLSDRLKADKQKKKRKKILLIFCSIIVFVGVIYFAVRGILRYQRINGSSFSSNSQGSSTYDIKSVMKSVTTICSPTDFKKLCEFRLMRAARRSKKKPTKPKDLIDKAISILRGEISRAMNRTNMIKSNDPYIHGAVADCEELFNDAMYDLHYTIKTARRVDLDRFPLMAPEIQNSLSAVMTYQQTCIDGFPDMDSRVKMDSEIKIGMELTSNALAIAQQSTAILSIFSAREIGFARRRLLEQTQNVPRWIPAEERILLGSKGRKRLKPDVVVAKDGTGRFQTITEALTAMPKKHRGRRYVIYVKTGIYNECPVINRRMKNVTMYGDGSRKTVITGSKNFADGVRTYNTATFVIVGRGFMAISMGFQNRAGPNKDQAVAIRVQSDKSIFLQCRIEGYQGTIYALTHRQFYRGCVISGTVDIIFGDAAAVFQKCKIIVRRPREGQTNIVTAQARIDRHESTGFVFHECIFQPDPQLLNGTKIPATYLSRPWKDYSRIIIMESDIGGFVNPSGYIPWEGSFALNTLYFGEFNNKGKSGSMRKRVRWPGVKPLNKGEATEFTVAAFIQGIKWITGTGVPVRYGLLQK